jgi:hypothetical protein
LLEKSADARVEQRRETPKRDRPEAWPPRTAHRGWNALKGTKPQERRPIKRRGLRVTVRLKFRAAQATRSGRSGQVSLWRQAGKQLADWFGRPQGAMAKTPRRRRKREHDAAVRRHRVRSVGGGSPRARPSAKANRAGGVRAKFIRVGPKRVGVG